MSGARGELEVSVETTEGAAVVRVGGELDLATIARLEEALGPLDDSGRMIFDLTCCTFLDSSAVRTIVGAARAADAAGGSVALVAADPTILRVLEIAAVDTLLPVHATVDAAL